MIDLTTFEKKALSLFFFFIFLGIVATFFFTISTEPVYASGGDQNSVPPSLSLLKNLEGEGFNLGLFEEIMFYLVEIVFPFIFVFFCLKIVLERAPIFKGSGKPEKRFFSRWVALSLSLIVVGNHVLFISGIIPLVFDPIATIQLAVPNLVWFVSSFFLVSLMVGIFDSTHEQHFTKLINKIFIVIGLFIVFWIIISPVSDVALNLITSILENIKGEGLENFAFWRTLAYYGAGLVAFIFMFMYLGLHKMFTAFFGGDWANREKDERDYKKLSGKFKM